MSIREDFPKTNCSNGLQCYVLDRIFASNGLRKFHYKF